MKHKLDCSLRDISTGLDGKPVISFEVNPGFAYSRAKPDILQMKKGKNVFTIDITERRNSRSLDQNALMWSLIDIMAQSAGIGPDDCYLDMIKSYGAKPDIIIAIPEAAESLRRIYRCVEDAGETREIVNAGTGGKTVGTIFRCWRGSSTYDTKEMTHLIDGIVAELYEMGVAKDLQADAVELVNQWNKHKGEKI